MKTLQISTNLSNILSPAGLDYLNLNIINYIKEHQNFRTDRILEINEQIKQDYKQNLVSREDAIAIGTTLKYIHSTYKNEGKNSIGYIQLFNKLERELSKLNETKTYVNLDEIILWSLKQKPTWNSPALKKVLDAIWSKYHRNIDPNTYYKEKHLMEKFLLAFKYYLKQKNYYFLDTHIVLEIYNVCKNQDNDIFFDTNTP